MSPPIAKQDCKRKHRSRAGRQAREKFDQRLDKVRDTPRDSREPLSIIKPEASTQTFNPQEFEIREINNFVEFSIFFENLLDKAEINLKKFQMAKRESQKAPTSKY